MLTIILVVINVILSLTCWCVLIIYGDTNYNNGSIYMDIAYRNDLFKKVFIIVILTKLVFFSLSYIIIKKMHMGSEFVLIFLWLFIANAMIYNYNLVGTIAYVNYEDGSYEGYSRGYKDAEKCYEENIN